MGKKWHLSSLKLSDKLYIIQVLQTVPFPFGKVAILLSFEFKKFAWFVYVCVYVCVCVCVCVRERERERERECRCNTIGHFLFCLQALCQKCHPRERESCTSKLVCHTAFKKALNWVAHTLVKWSQRSHIISENTGIKYFMDWESMCP